MKAERASVDTPGEPYARIVHVDLDSDRLPARTDLQRALYVFWTGERPVAQLWIRAGQGGDEVRNFMAQLRVEPPPAQQGPLPRSMSLVICTRDRPAELARCLRSLAGQSRTPDEILVVDNASQGAGTRLAAEAAGVRYVREERPGLDIARNTGFRAATSEVVAYTDDDTELHPRWLERILGAFDSDQVMAVTGLVLPASLDTEAQWLFERDWGFGRGYARIDFGPEFYRATRNAGCPAWKVGAGANMAFRRAIFDRVGPFDERLDVGAAGCSGDSEMWYRILAAGWTCRYEPSAVLFHHHRRTMDALRRQIFHYLRGHVAALMIQFERTGDLGNLRRAFLAMPYGYLRGAAGRILRGKSSYPLLGAQVRGAASGLMYYLRSRLPLSRAENMLR